MCNDYGSGCVKILDVVANVILVMQYRKLASVFVLGLNWNVA